MRLEVLNHLKNSVYIDKDTWRLKWIRNGKNADSINGTGYYQVKFYFKGKRLTMGSHRFIYSVLVGIPANFVDHIDRDRSNNNINNLRDVSRSLNAYNSNVSKISKSGITGVIWNKKQSKWHSRIVKNGKEYHLGSFSCPAVALCERKLKEKELYGEMK